MEKIKLQKALYEQEKQKALKRREKLQKLINLKEAETIPKSGHKTYRKGKFCTPAVEESKLKVESNWS